jgi:hypothetical protein
MPEEARLICKAYCTVWAIIRPAGLTVRVAELAIQAKMTRKKASKRYPIPDIII